MARLNNGGIIGKQVTTPTSSAASGKWNLSEQNIYKSSNAWPTGILTQNLSLYFDPGIDGAVSGSTIIDQSSSGLNGTITGMTYSTQYGGTIRCEGAAAGVAHISTSSSSQFNLNSTDWSFGTWTYHDSSEFTSNIYRVMLSLGSSVSEAYYSFALWRSGYLTTTAGAAYAYSGLPNTSIFSTGNQSAGYPNLSTSFQGYTGNWVNTYVVKNSTDIRVYINGTLYGTIATFNLNSQNNRVFYGGGTNESIKGYLGPLTIYKGKALTGAEISNNFNFHRSRYGI